MENTLVDTPVDMVLFCCEEGFMLHASGTFYQEHPEYLTMIPCVLTDVTVNHFTNSWLITCNAIDYTCS